MEKYLIYYNESADSKKFVYNVGRTSNSHSTDVGDAIEFDNKETALRVRDYINSRDGVTKYRVMCIKTTTEEVTG